MKHNTYIVPIPEVSDASETDQIEIGEHINSLLWCVALFLSIALGIACLIMYPDIYNTTTILYYISFAMVIEIISVIIAGFALFIWCAILKTDSGGHFCHDAIGIFSFCTICVSNVGHLITMPVGLYILTHYTG
jgi:hypothetical protein